MFRHVPELGCDEGLGAGEEVSRDQQGVIVFEMLPPCSDTLRCITIRCVAGADQPAKGIPLDGPAVGERVGRDEAIALVRTGVRANPLADLTPRELQTLSLLAEGKPYGRIAEELNVSYKTVVNACSQLKQKLNAKNLPELIRLAVQLLSAES